MKNEKFTLKRINEILTSEPPKLFTPSVTDKEKENTIERNIGDRWEDSDGNIWEQKEGYRVKMSKNHEIFQKIRDELSIPKICPKCNNEMKTWQDKKFYRIHKMCMRCVVLFEHELRITGKYEEYEKNKIKENSLAWLRDAEKEVEILKESLKIEYVNEDGSIEKWESDISPEEMKEKIQVAFDKFKEEFLKKLE